MPRRLLLAAAVCGALLTAACSQPSPASVPFTKIGGVAGSVSSSSSGASAGAGASAGSSAAAGAGSTADAGGAGAAGSVDGGSTAGTAGSVGGGTSLTDPLGRGGARVNPGGVGDTGPGDQVRSGVGAP